MSLLDIFYSNYYRFYKKVIKDSEPHVATILALSLSESLLINGLVDIIVLNGLCYKLDFWFEIGVTIALIYINHLVYVRRGRSESAAAMDPAILGSNNLSVLITWMFFVVTTLWLFWGSMYAKYVIEQCK